MTTFKKTTAGGEWDGQRAQGRYDSVEFDIPPEVLAKGLGAIIDWINKAPKVLAGAVAVAAVGASLAKSFALDDSATGLRGWCEIELKTRLRDILGFGRELDVARVFDETLLVRHSGNRASLRVPTAVVQSLSALKDGRFVVQYLDGTVIEGFLETEEILIEPRTGILYLRRGVPEKLAVKRLKLIRVLASRSGETVPGTPRSLSG